MTEPAVAWRLVDALMGLVILGLSGWISTMWAEIKDMRKKAHDQHAELSKLQLFVVSGYVKHDEFKTSMREMTEAVAKGFTRMEDRMDDIYRELKQKVDKTP